MLTFGSGLMTLSVPTRIRITGVSALYRGIMSKLVQSVLTAAFLFMSKVSSAAFEGFQRSWRAQPD